MKDRRLQRLFSALRRPADVLFLLLALGASAPVALAGPTPVSGIITTNTTWTPAGSPYIVTGTVSVVGSGTTPVTLTIQAGVEVRFTSGTWLQIGSGSGANQGSLDAQGTAASNVVFTSDQTTKTPGFWGGIRVQPTSTALLQYSTIEYGGAGNLGMVYVDASTATLQNCTIRNGSSYGIQVISGGLSLTSVTMSGTGGTYSVTMPLTTSVTSTGTHTIDKPIELRSGTISMNTTWKNLGAPYVLSGTSYVHKDPTTAATLTVDPGVEVRFASAVWLFVGLGTSLGTLNAQGTATSPVLFTSDQTTKTPGYWSGIRVETTSTALLQYSTIEYGGNGGTGMIYVNGSSPTLQNCTIRNGSSYAIQVISGGLSLTSVTMSGTGGTYSVTMPLTTSVTSTGTHTIDKPIELRSGTISANTTWKNLGAPYVLSGTSYVHKDPTTASTLTVDPGVEVRFGSGVWLQVGLGTSLGTLNAQGTATSPVLFTSNQTTKTPGYWRGVRFDPGAASTSLVQHTTIEYGGNGGFGMVYVNGSSPTLQNCTMRQSGADGVQVLGASAAALKASSFTSNALAAVNNTGSLMADARASWWAHISGPSGGAPGSGQKIVGNVIYSPWLEAAPKPALHATSGQITKFLFDKTDDATAFLATLNRTANWTLTVKDQNNTTMKTYSGSGASINQSWNGEQTAAGADLVDRDHADHHDSRHGSPARHLGGAGERQRLLHLPPHCERREQPAQRAHTARPGDGDLQPADEWARLLAERRRRVGHLHSHRDAEPPGQLDADVQELVGSDGEDVHGDERNLGEPGVGREERVRIPRAQRDVHIFADRGRARLRRGRHALHRERDRGSDASNGFAHGARERSHGLRHDHDQRYRDRRERLQQLHGGIRCRERSDRVDRNRHVQCAGQRGNSGDLDHAILDRRAARRWRQRHLHDPAHGPRPRRQRRHGSGDGHARRHADLGREPGSDDDTAQRRRHLDDQLHAQSAGDRDPADPPRADHDQGLSGSDPRKRRLAHDLGGLAPGRSAGHRLARQGRRGCDPSRGSLHVHHRGARALGPVRQVQPLHPGASDVLALRRRHSNERRGVQRVDEHVLLACFRRVGRSGPWQHAHPRRRYERPGL